MASYVVMQPQGGASADRTVLVRDGFAWLAFIAPPLWLLWNRLWIEALLAFAAAALLTGLGEAAGLGTPAAALSLLVSLYVGLEANAMRVAALRRRGWKEWGVVEAANRADADIRFVAAGDEPLPAPPPPARMPLSRSTASGPALGLFDYPGRP